MIKIFLIFLALALLCCRVDSQNRLRPVDKQRPNPPGPNGRGERHPNRREGREDKGLQNSKELEEEDDYEVPSDRLAQNGKNGSEVYIQHPRQQKGNIAKETIEKPPPNNKQLLKLIFILVGALVLIVVILLLKLFGKNQVQIPENCVLRSGQGNPEPVSIVYPKIELQQQIQMHRKRLKHLETLKKIKEKYLASSINSQMELAAQEKKIEEELKTPAFSIPFTFRTTM